MTIDDYKEMEPQQIEALIEELVVEALKKGTYKTGYNWLKRNTPDFETILGGLLLSSFIIGFSLISYAFWGWIF